MASWSAAHSVLVGLAGSLLSEPDRFEPRVFSGKSVMVLGIDHYNQRSSAAEHTPLGLDRVPNQLPHMTIGPVEISPFGTLAASAFGIKSMYGQEDTGGPVRAFRP